ncbi:MAG: aspartate aminotransferase family protein [Dehalococcoidia bacterium]
MTTLSEETISGLVRQDLAHLIHPQYYAPDHQEPVIFDHGEGVWLVDVRGNRYIDGLSSLWNVAVGHGRGELADAAAEQIRKVAFTNNYTGFSNVPAIELAAKVVELAYDNLSGVYFTNSGSESNEGALKTARFYWNLQGRPSKVKLIARERAYHGGTLATSAMTGLPPFWKYFGPLPPEIVHTAQPDNLECDCELNSDGECAHWLEAAIQREGADTVAAFIAEPVKGAGGVWTPAAEYFGRVREICDRYEVLFISDEVITGFGRTGRWFALEHWGVQPDILSVAKAITSGYIPMGAFLVSDAIMEALRTVPPDARFMHAYTNSAHPTAAAVALRNLQIFEDEHLVENAEAMGARLGDGLRSALGGHAHVTNLRNLGLIAGLSLVRDAETGEAYDAADGVGGQVARHMREEGQVITRFVGDHIVLAPPLVVNGEEVDHILGALEAAVRAVTGE